MNQNLKTGACKTVHVSRFYREWLSLIKSFEKRWQMTWLLWRALSTQNAMAPRSSTDCTASVKPVDEIRKTPLHGAPTGTSVANGVTPVFDTGEFAPVNRDLGGRSEVLRSSTGTEANLREDNLQSRHESDGKDLVSRRAASAGDQLDEMMGPLDSEMRWKKRRCRVTVIAGSISGAPPCQISSVLLRLRSFGERMYMGKRSRRR